MKEEYVNSFLAPAKMVWDKELGKTLNLAKAEIVSHQFTTEEVTASSASAAPCRAAFCTAFQKLPPRPL